MTKKESYFVDKGYTRRRRRRRQRGGYWSGINYHGNNYNTFKKDQRYRLYGHGPRDLPQDVVISGVAPMGYIDDNPVVIGPNQYLVTLKKAGTDGERRIVTLGEIDYYQNWIPDGKAGPGGAGPGTPREGHGRGGRRRRKSCKRRRRKRTRRRKKR